MSLDPRYNVNFDIDAFFQINVEDQKLRMLDFVEDSLSKAFSEMGIGTDLLGNFREFVIQRKFKSTFSGPSSSRGDIDACVVCEQGFESADIFIALKKAGYEIERIFLLNTSPEEFIFNVYLCAPKWLSDDKLKLVASNGECILAGRGLSPV